MNRIRYFTNRHAGSAHDSRIWEESQMKADLDRRSPDHLQYILGDEAFRCSSTLLTIVRNPEVEKITDPVRLTKVKAYNNALKKTRVKIEHTFGYLKKRFPVLLYQMRCRKIENVQAIIASCVVLHNFLIKDGHPITNLTEEELQNHLEHTDMRHICPSRTGQYRVRDHVIENFF